MKKNLSPFRKLNVLRSCALTENLNQLVANRNKSFKPCSGVSNTMYALVMINSLIFTIKRRKKNLINDALFVEKKFLLSKARYPTSIFLQMSNSKLSRSSFQQG